MTIESPHDRQKHRTGLVRRGEGFVVDFWRLAVTFYWGLGWFVTMNRIEFINLYPKTGWEEVRTTNYSRVRLVSNYFIAFIDNILYNTDI